MMKLHSASLIRAMAVAAALLSPSLAMAIDADTDLVCSLVGEGTHNGTNASSTHQPNLNLYGTDLGFSVKHRWRVFMLFGDTWIRDDFICAPPVLSDDSMGWINLFRDNDPDDCLDIRFPTELGGDVRPIRVLDDGVEQPMGPFQTPITGWSDNRHVYGYFSGDVATCNPAEGPSCADGLDCVLGFCVDPTTSLAPAGPLWTLAFVRRIAIGGGLFSPEVFDVGYNFVTNKFVNATARVIGRFREGNPDKNIYAPTLRPRHLLVWGRPGFAAPAGATADLYLLHHRLSRLDGPGDTIRWEPRYFAGLNGDQEPTWTSDQKLAAPVIAGEEIAEVLQFSIAWVPGINRFVMLYSGRLPRVPSSADTGIYLRTADHPWGPWTEPELFWNAAAEGAYDCPGIMYDGAVAGMSCPESDPYRPDFFNGEGLNMCPAPSPGINPDFGVEYGVNILSTFSKPGLAVNSATIYWNMSTWNPYRVVLMKTHLNDPIIVSP